MKATLTLEFNSPEALYDTVARLHAEVGPSEAPAPYVPAAIREIPSSAGTPPTEQPAATKPPRKPRNDAGKPRGPYKAKDNEGAGGDLQATTASPAGQAAVPVPLSQSAAPAEPVSAPQAPAGAASVAAPAAAAPGTEPTYDDAKAALRRMNDTKGMGTPACIAHLQQFGTNQLSLLPRESYALFIKQADEKIAEFLAGQKK